MRGNAEAVAGQVRVLLADFLDKIPPRFNRILFLSRIERLASLIAFWGTRINLTAAPEDPGEIAFHVLDSLAPIIFSEEDRLTRQAFDQHGQWLDLGSGAGFPGLVLASAASANFTLLERRRKRASFLAVAASEIGLQNVTVEQRLPMFDRSSSLPSSEQQTTPSLTSLRSVDGFKESPPVPRHSTNDATPSPTSPGHGKAGNQPLPITIGVSGSFDAVTAKAFGPAPLFHSAAARALKAGGLAVLYANSRQNLALPEAEKSGFCEFRRIEYVVPRNGRPVRRILGFWRRV